MQNDQPPRFFKVIACEIAFREICHLAARSSSLLDLEFLTQGYHDTPKRGREALQERIEAVPPGKYQAVLLGYGLCSNILTGLKSVGVPLVIPRAHDCITFFLGSKERYRSFFDSHPGTYYYTSGWLECVRRRGLGTAGEGPVMLPLQGRAEGMPSSFEAMVEKYGEDQARYLMEVMGQWTASYQRGVLIDYDFTRALGFEREVRGICGGRGWDFERVEGDLGLLQRWLDGDWSDQEFLVVPPGQEVAASYDDGVMAATPGAGPDKGCG